MAMLTSDEMARKTKAFSNDVPWQVFNSDGTFAKTLEPQKEAKYEYVNHPDHYLSNGMETIEKMVLIYGLEDTAKFCEMTAFKYFDRAGNKPNEPLKRDIEKIEWYKNKAKELREMKEGK